MRLLICPGYLLGAFVAARLIYVWQVDKYDAKSDDALFVAAMGAVIWPLIAVFATVVGGGFWVLSRTVGRETATQRDRRLRREAKDAEWEAAKLAREFDLPDGGTR